MRHKTIAPAARTTRDPLMQQCPTGSPSRFFRVELPAGIDRERISKEAVKRLAGFTPIG